LASVKFVMRVIRNCPPIAAPIEIKDSRLSQLSKVEVRLVRRRRLAREILGAAKNPDVKSDAKVMVRTASRRICNDVALRRSALRIQRVLLCVGSPARQNLDCVREGFRSHQELPRGTLSFRN